MDALLLDPGIAIQLRKPLLPLLGILGDLTRRALFVLSLRFQILGGLHSLQGDGVEVVVVGVGVVVVGATVFLALAGFALHDVVVVVVVVVKTTEESTVASVGIGICDFLSWLDGICRRRGRSTTLQVGVPGIGIFNGVFERRG